MAQRPSILVLWTEQHSQNPLGPCVHFLGLLKQTLLYMRWLRATETASLAMMGGRKTEESRPCLWIQGSLT